MVKAMRDFTHLRSGTVLMALLQPAPEVYNLFDDVLLMSEGTPPYAESILTALALARDSRLRTGCWQLQLHDA